MTPSSYDPPRPPRALRRPPKGSVLVVAPHPDDETVGCGGTLALHARQKDPIHVLFICSGIQGDPDGYFPRDDLPRLREEEAREAGKDLGVGGFTFFGYPDNLSERDFSDVFEGLPKDPKEQRRALIAGLAQKIADVIATVRPTIVYHPWIGEANADHFAAAKAIEVLRDTRPDLRESISFLGYDVWTPSPADLVIDVSDAMATKLAAVSRYRTQLVYRDYGRATAGFNAYRSLFLEPGATYGESFVGAYRGLSLDADAPPAEKDDA